MIYSNYLKNVKACPFCDCRDRVFMDRDEAFLTYAKAPYHPDHLLVIPKRHIVSFFDLTANELNDINELVSEGSKILQKLGYTNFSILVREGDSINKSIPHLHYHLIPNDRIGDLDHNGEPRQVMSLVDIAALSDRIFKTINN